MGGFEACHTTLLVQLCDAIKMILTLRSEASLWAAFGPVTASESGSVTSRRFTDTSRPISQDSTPLPAPSPNWNTHTHIPRLPHSSASSGTLLIFQNADKKKPGLCSTLSRRRPPLRSLSTNRCSDEYQTSDSQREKVVPVRSAFFLLRAQD